MAVSTISQAGLDAPITLTSPTLGAGTALLPSIKLTSGTNLTSAIAGAIEYDGKVVYGTPLSTERGIIPTQQYYRLNAAYVGTNVATAQSVFGVGVTLSASTVYEFEIVFNLLKTAGSTAHTIGFGFGGTATINNISQNLVSQLNTTTIAVNNTATTGFISTATNTTISQTTGAATTLYLNTIIKGTVSVNAGGTFIPQYTCSAAPGGAYSTQIGSYIRINPLSASGAATNVGTWA